MKDGIKSEYLRVENFDVTTQEATTSNADSYNTSGNSVFTIGSPYSEGIVFRGWNAEAIISGGMFVIGSEGVLKAAPADTAAPLGIATATTASGAVCPVLVTGPAYVKAEATIGAGIPVTMGAGAALNVIKVGADASGCGTCLIGASSGGTALIFLK